MSDGEYLRKIWWSVWIFGLVDTLLLGLILSEVSK